jgi:5-methylcytosine-specific restriction protein A
MSWHHDRSGYCEKHRNEGWQQHQQGKSSERGYGSQWDIRRARILKRDNHLCQNCLRNGRAVAAKTVDHIKAKAHGGTDDDSNLESLCWPCHRTKTGRERSNDINSHLDDDREGRVKSLTAKAQRTAA